MNLNDYLYLLNHPKDVTEKQTEDLIQILDEFPYFQSARAIRLKGLYDQNSFRYNYALKVTAAHTTDRSVLFDFICSPEFVSFKQSQSKVIYETTTTQIPEKNTEFTAVANEEITTEKLEEIQDFVNENTEFIAVANEEIATEKLEETQDFLNENTEFIAVANEEIATEKLEETQEFANENIEFIAVANEEIATEKLEETQEFVNENTEFIAVANEEIATEKLEETQNFEEVTEEINPVEASILSSIKEATEKSDFVQTEEKNEFYSLAEASILNSIKEATENNETKIVEEKLELGKPLDFSSTEKHSFQEWLQLASLKPIDRETVAENVSIPMDEAKKKKLELIDKFIETNPKIPSLKQISSTSPSFDLNKEDQSFLMTETLAKVYLEQKKYQKAIQAYEILILKYPEKISFFADRISDIKILQQNNNNLQ